MRLHGVVVPIVTPLTAHDEVDRDGLQRLVQRLIGTGVHGIFVAGTTGEVLALKRRTRLDAIAAVCDAVGGRIAVVAGVVSNCLQEILDYSEAAADSGAGYLALQPPPYFPLDNGHIAKFYEQVAERAPLPLVLYNLPQMTNNRISTENVLKLAADPRIAGIKDSSGDLAYFKAVVEHRTRPDFRVFMGDEALCLEGLRMGADGIVPSLANVHPELCCACYEACRQGDWAAAQARQQEILDLITPLRSTGSWLCMLKWIKGQLQEQGVCEAHVSSIFAEAPSGIRRLNAVG